MTLPSQQKENRDEFYKFYDYYKAHPENGWSVNDICDRLTASTWNNAHEEGYLEGVKDGETKTRNGVKRYQLGYEDGQKAERERVRALLPKPWPREETFDQGARGWRLGYDSCLEEITRNIAALDSESNGGNEKELTHQDILNEYGHFLQ